MLSSNDLIRSRRRRKANKWNPYRQRRRLLRLEPLEDRRLLAVFDVNSTLDSVDFSPGDGFARDAAGNTTVRAAVMESNALAGPDTINVPAGTYNLTISGADEDAAATGDLDIADDLTIVGADPATAIIDASQLDRVFHVWGASVATGPTVSISNLTITGGRTSDTSALNDGGGILNQRATLTVDNCIVRDNQTGYGYFGGQGGGLYSELGSLTVANSTITGNTTGNGQEMGGMGGGVAGNASTITISDSVVTNNQTGDGRLGPNLATAGRGGGVYSESGVPSYPATLTITGTTISGNVVGTDTKGYGGGILNYTVSTMVLENSMVSNNRAHRGGGIMVDNGTAERIVDSTIADNIAQGGEGGGIHNQVGVILLLSGNTISGNQAPNPTSVYGGGGGIMNWGEIGTAVNNTISGNTTDGVGGGIANLDHIGLILNTTIAANTADDGGGIFNAVFANMTPTISELTNSILGDNVASGTTAADLQNLGAVTAATHNLVEDPDGHGIIDGINGNIVGVDPLLGPLADNGAPRRPTRYCPAVRPSTPPIRQPRRQRTSEASPVRRVPRPTSGLSSWPRPARSAAPNGTI